MSLEDIYHYALRMGNLAKTYGTQVNVGPGRSEFMASQALMDAAPAAAPGATVSKYASDLIGGASKANPYLAIGSLVLGGVQSAIAARRLSQLDKNKPAGYQITPEEQEVFNRTKEAARYGFSQQEKDAYLGNMAKQQEVNYQRSLSVGGGSLAGAIGASTSKSDLSGFATSDAQLKRQAEGKYQQALMGKSRKRDLMAEQELSDYARKQQAWGGALQAGLENMTSAANLAMATGYSNNT
jgi:hypothetical protein